MRKLYNTTRARPDLLVAATLFVGAFVLYLLTLAPTVASIYDDSLEFPLVVQRLAIAHPTGYPLYILLGKLFSLLPVRDVAYRVHLLSALAAAGALVCVYLAARALDIQRVGALAGALLLAVSPVFWSQALIAEVYALNALFAAALLAIAVWWRRQGDAGGRGRLLALFFFVMGLSLTHHRTIVLLWPALLSYLLLAGWRPWRQPGQTLRLLFLFCMPLLLYAYIPWRGMSTSSLDGTYQNTWQGFWGWVAGSAYTVFLSGNPLQQAPLTLQGLGDIFLGQFGLPGLALAGLGLAWLLVRRRAAFVLLALGAAPIVAFALVYRVADTPVFLIPAFVLAAPAMAGGVQALAVAWVRLPDWQPPPFLSRLYAEVQAGLPRTRLALAVLLFVVALPLQALLHTLPQADRSRDWRVHNYALDVLSQPLAQNGAVVGILGEMTLLRYVQETQGLRPDIEPVAADTDEARLAAVAQLLAEGRPVYLTRPLAGLERNRPQSALGPLIAVGDAAAPQASPQTQTAVRFGNDITLLGYSVSGLASALRPAPASGAAPDAYAGGRMRVTLFWRAERSISTDYRVTVRLVTPTGRLLWQHDGSPVHNAYPMSAWQPGRTVVDSHDLLVPIGTPPGSYDIRVGLYHPTTLQPMPGQNALFELGPVPIAAPAQPPALGSLPLRAPTAEAGLSLPDALPAPSLELLGVHSIVRANFENEVILYGYGIAPGVLTPGQTAEVTLLWQALRRPTGPRVVFVQIFDANGRLWASQESQPVEGAYPSDEWQRDEVVRDRHVLRLPADMPDGEYRVQAGLYDALGRRLTELQWTRRSRDHASLGTVSVRGRPRVMDLPRMDVQASGLVGHFGQIRGYNLTAGASGEGPAGEGVRARPGDSVRISIVWQALESAPVSYTVFVHLLGPAGQMVSQDDALPGRGAMPTTTWVRGEVIVDAYTLTVPAGAAPGVYEIEVGMYDAGDGTRVPTWDGNGRSTGGRLIIAKVYVESAP